LTQAVYGSGPEYGNSNGVAELFRWGDYSAVYMRSTNQNHALAVNEIPASSGATGVSNVWSSKIAEVRFP
jgi:hypothetical protein